MPTPQEQRMIRLKNDYQEMENIRGPIVQWHPLSGTAPYVEAYELTVNVRTIIGPAPAYRNSHVLRLTLPPTYPIAAPYIIMLTSPKPFHPNWWPDRHWCFGTWVVSEGLGHHVVRMLRTLQFDTEITNPDSPADTEAKAWYLANLQRGLFPCDRQVLPDPTQRQAKKTFEIQSSPRKRFDIH